jgi:hypothetical protein
MRGEVAGYPELRVGPTAIRETAEGAMLEAADATMRCGVDSPARAGEAEGSIVHPATSHRTGRQRLEPLNSAEAEEQAL